MFYHYGNIPMTVLCRGSKVTDINLFPLWFNLQILLGIKSNPDVATIPTVSSIFLYAQRKTLDDEEMRRDLKGDYMSRFKYTHGWRDLCRVCKGI